MAFYDGPVDGDFGGGTTTGFQRFLSVSGYDPGPIDGSWGEGSSKALQSFLKDAGFYAGAIDGYFLNGEGESVTSCQKWLSSVGQDPGPADGKWGDVSIKALQKFLKGCWSCWNPDAMCEGIRAEERMQWLVDNQSMSVDDAKSKVKSEFPALFLKTCWDPEAMCDGIRAEERAKWLMDNQGMSADDAKSKVKSEFPGTFLKKCWSPDTDCDGITAGARMQWLIDNQGMSVDEAKSKVISEFPAAGVGADFIDCKFPHTMSVVDGKLKFAVTPKKPSEVSMVAVHYQINGGASMNFDINSPEAGTNTYVHVTPKHGENCPPGAKVSYWLCANVKGLLETEPHGACGHADRRLYWTAR